MSNSSSEHKVHFQPVEVQAHDSEITLKYSEKRIDVHLGFLQINRHYTVTFVMQDDLGEDLTFDPLQNLHARVTKYEPTEDGLGHQLEMDFHAHREKLIQERVSVKSITGNGNYRDIVLHARVLGKGKGTPALRNGIKCSQVDDDNDSDVTDWQGFD
ncbi:CT027-like protein [Mya arenaria]|uniref:Adipose-secreted signaling protein n=2 Tax=Mya arenaria TaxID=6604 RepID=A0ABY7FLL8_MYAAR|nr:UPF0687 protein C20orf27 homolog isoform X2 [Mya arenaria]XP_052773827.1 UPF0687 protein C20orf27 homolog isoform X2 [Mya arenaria]WAR22059.1 CT027-like protein [Mya arenaria]